MDAGVMRARFESLMQDVSWQEGVGKQALLDAVAQDEALHTLVEEYIPDERFTDLDYVCTLIPVQAWQDTQGDEWRGAESEEAGASASHFRDSPVARDE